MDYRDFDNYFNEGARKLVQRYELMRSANTSLFFEESSFEQLIDYYEACGKIELAFEVVEMATEQYPYSSGFLVKKAQLLFGLKKIDEAHAALDEAKLYDPRDLDIFLLKSDIHVWLSEHRAAVCVLKSALEIIGPDELEDIYLEIADVYEDWEKYDRVIEYLQKVLTVNANNEEALGRLWFCVELTETYRESIEFHIQLTNEEPYSYMAWFNLAHAYTGLKKYEKSIESFEFAIAINDKYDYAYRDCGEVLMKTGQYAKAADYFIQATLFSEPTKELYFNIGVCFEQLKKDTFGNMSGF